MCCLVCQMSGDERACYRGQVSREAALSAGARCSVRPIRLARGFGGTMYVLGSAVWSMFWWVLEGVKGGVVNRGVGSGEGGFCVLLVLLGGGVLLRAL